MSIWGVRELLMRAIPDSLKHAIAVGIGLLITLVGLEWGGWVQSNPATYVALGNLRQPAVWMSGAGILVTLVLLIRRWRGAILCGIFTSTAIGLALGVVKFHGFVSAPPSIAPIALKLDIWGALSLGAVPVIFIFFFLDLFDSIGSLIGIAEQGGFMQSGELPRAREALLADAVATCSAGLLGNSTAVSYIESAAGVAEGAKTGLAAAVAGLLMLSGLFLSPLARMIGEGYAASPSLTLYPTVAPALIVVGSFMMRNVGKIAWKDPQEYLPAFLTIVLIPFTFSITDGIAFGFISYVLLSIVSGQFQKVHWLMVLFTILFIVRYVALRTV
jgi:AGZA family xanthine/uracil permease-like MFS transporter